MSIKQSNSKIHRFKVIEDNNNKKGYKLAELPYSNISYESGSSFSPPTENRMIII